MSPMAFVENPLSLSIPPETFEAWLRDSGYLEVLDRCAIDPATRAGARGLLSSALSFLVDPFGNLTAEDLSKPPVRWTGEFWDCGHGLPDSYGRPLSGTQLKLRMAENLKRYMGNYVRLFFLILACFIYKIPKTLVGILIVLVLWDGIRKLTNSFDLKREGISHQALLLFGKVVTAVVMIYCKVALAVCWAGIFSLAGNALYVLGLPFVKLFVMRIDLCFCFAILRSHSHA